MWMILKVGIAVRSKVCCAIRWQMMKVTSNLKCAHHVPGMVHVRNPPNKIDICWTSWRQHVKCHKYHFHAPTRKCSSHQQRKDICLRNGRGKICDIKVATYSSTSHQKIKQPQEVKVNDKKKKKQHQYPQQSHKSIICATPWFVLLALASAFPLGLPLSDTWVPLIHLDINL